MGDLSDGKNCPFVQRGNAINPAISARQAPAQSSTAPRPPCHSCSPQLKAVPTGVTASRRRAFGPSPGMGGGREAAMLPSKNDVHGLGVALAQQQVVLLGFLQ